MGQLNSMYQKTEWHNPTPHTVTFDIFIGPGNTFSNEIRPGDSMEVPTVFDNAIQTIRDGVIVGGKAPQLVAKGRKEIPMHDALARAAAQGDVERAMLRQTGTTAGSLSFDMGAQLMKQANEAKAETEQMKAQNEALMARLAALEAAIPSHAPAPRLPDHGEHAVSDLTHKPERQQPKQDAKPEPKAAPVK